MSLVAYLQGYYHFVVVPTTSFREIGTLQHCQQIFIESWWSLQVHPELRLITRQVGKKSTFEVSPYFLGSLRRSVPQLCTPLRSGSSWDRRPSARAFFFVSLPNVSWFVQNDGVFETPEKIYVLQLRSRLLPYMLPYYKDQTANLHLREDVPEYAFFRGREVQLILAADHIEAGGFQFVVVYSIQAVSLQASQD